MDVLQHLREATRPQHEAIEARVDLLRPDLSLAEYQRLLERFYGFYVPLEAKLANAAPWEQWDFSFAERQKARFLARDLYHLGASQGEVAALPRCPDLPAVTSLAAALGCLYVIEGATLGGQLIARHVMPLLGLSPETGCAFFTSYGTEVGRRWRALGELLRAQLTTAADADRAATAAHDTFAKLDHWLAGGNGQYEGA